MPSDIFTMPWEHRYEDMLLCDMHSFKEVKRVAEMDLDDGDVVVASYPKTGTTVMQEIVWLVRNHADVKRSREVANYARVPYIDIGVTDMVQVYKEQPRPRLMKTHVPYRFLPKAVLEHKNKCVYSIRNPKDTLVSYYHFHRMNAFLGNFKGSWNDFFQYMMDNDGLVLMGNPCDHTQGYWQHRNDKNLLIVHYEDIIRDRVNVTKKVAAFLGEKLTEAQVQAIADATDFETMRKDPMTNMDLAKSLPPGAPKPPMDHSISPFLRKGKIGDWKDYFTREQSEIVDKWVEEKLTPLGLKFVYE